MTRDEHLQRVIDIAEGRWTSANEVSYSDNDSDYYPYMQTIAILDIAEAQKYLAAAQAMDMIKSQRKPIDILEERDYG
jgi:hypothetical protein